MVVRMWGSQNFDTLLVGIENDPNTLGKGPAISNKSEDISSLQK